MRSSRRERLKEPLASSLVTFWRYYALSVRGGGLFWRWHYQHSYL
jgi:hypothetical protein